MPYINTTANINITKEKEEIIKSRYAQAVSIIGKGEAYLMLGFNSGVSMYFGGKNDSPLAFVEVKFLGNASSDKLNALTGEICKIISEELNIAPDKIYVKYEPTEHWGWNGANF
ncbi:MAG: phenylpyruvate tautomerase MIF-related protein [Acutalibacteraceae bacterium]|nr:phenylpyruvate tautomerase MIF-related protein [Acutalibacteraceae bacterium]